MDTNSTLCLIKAKTQMVFYKVLLLIVTVPVYFRNRENLYYIVVITLVQAYTVTILISLYVFYKFIFIVIKNLLHFSRQIGHSFFLIGNYNLQLNYV